MGKTRTIMEATDKLTFMWLVDGSSPYIHDIDSVIRACGWAPLNDSVAKILCAIESGRVVGFHVLQMFPHVEPLWVAPEHRGTGLAEELADRMLNFMTDIGARGFMVIADTPYAEKLCRDRGMKRVTSPVYIL